MKEYTLKDHEMTLKDVNGEPYVAQLLDRAPTEEEMKDWPEAEKLIYQRLPPLTHDIVKEEPDKTPARCKAGWTGNPTFPHRLPIFLGYRAMKRDEPYSITDGMCEHCLAANLKSLREKYDILLKESLITESFEEYAFRNLNKLIVENYKKMK